VVILDVGGRSAWSDERTEEEGSDTARRFELTYQLFKIIAWF
jgi:hypothetical protein